MSDTSPQHPMRNAALAEVGHLPLSPAADSSVQFEYEVADLSYTEQEERLRPPCPVMMVQAAAGVFETDDKDVEESDPLTNLGGESEHGRDVRSGTHDTMAALSAKVGGGAAQAGTAGGSNLRAELTKLWEKGLEALYNQSYLAALAYFKRLLKEDPNRDHHHGYTWNAAMCHAQLGNTQEALSLFQSYPNLSQARADKIAKAKQYVLMLKGTPDKGAESKTQAADTIKLFTAAQKKLLSGTAKFQRVCITVTGVSDKGSNVPSWFGPAVGELATIGQPFNSVLEQAKKNMTPGIYTWDMLMDNIENFAREYDIIADDAVDVASGTGHSVQEVSGTMKCKIALLDLHIPPGMGKLAMPLGDYFKGLRPRLVKLSNSHR